MITITNEDNMALMARYPDKYFDLAIVDPPYGIKRFSEKTNLTEGSKYRKSMQRLCDNSHKFNDIKPTNEYWSELNRVSKSQIIWGANNFNLPETEYFLIWNKMQTVDNFSSAELAFVYGIKKPAKVFTYQIHKHNQNKISDHSSEKPVALYKWILDTYTTKLTHPLQPKDKILDTHLGSGSIAIACHDYGFDLTACELDKDYYEAAMNRINNHMAQQKMF